MTHELKNRRALVTGASRGIGLSIAIELASRGARVALVAREDTSLQQGLAQLRDAGGEGDAFSCDVTDPIAIAALHQAVLASFGPIDILVNNAGAAESAPFSKVTAEAWHHALAINLTSVFSLTQAFLPGMIERQWGRVINIASTAGKMGHAYVVPYCAAKHGVIGLTKALALEMARKGITVNAICPSYVDTEMTQRSIANIAAKTGRSEAEAAESLLSVNPQHRLVDTDEVASMVAYLASDAARGVNGQAWNLCGGATPL